MQEYNNNVYNQHHSIDDCKLVFSMTNYKNSTYTKMF